MLNDGIRMSPRFSPDTGGGAQGGPDGAGDQPEAQGGATDGARDAPESLTLTQAELEAKIAAAKGQADRTALNRYLKAFGVTRAEADALLAAKRAERRPEGSDEEDGAPPAAHPGEDAYAKARTLIVNAELRAAAALAGFYDPGDAVAFADREGISVDEDGSARGIREAIGAMVKAKPHLVKPRSAPPRGGGIGGGGDGGQPENYGAQLAKRKLEQQKKALEGLDNGNGGL